MSQGRFLYVIINTITKYRINKDKMKEQKVMKIAKKVLKTIGVLLGFIVVIVLGYIIYLYASYHRIEDNKSLSVESHTETKQTLTTGKQYSAITYNIGFGAYTPEFSFFMDG